MPKGTAHRWSQHTPGGVKALPEKVIKPAAAKTAEAPPADEAAPHPWAAALSRPAPLQPKTAADEPARRTAFRLGFLTGLAEAGMTPGDMLDGVKRAFDPFEAAVDVGKMGLGAGASIVGPALKALGTAALLAPPALGAAAGLASSRLDSPTDDDVRLLRRQELLRVLEGLSREVRSRSGTMAPAEGGAR